EEKKGPAAVVEAHAILKQMAEHRLLNFIGNIEGMDIPRGTADVVITGGFVGNIVLKMLEGVADTVRNLGRYAMRQSVMYKAGLALLSPGLKQLKAVTDWQQYGGAPVLGFDQICIKAHGRSSARAIRNAIKVANKAARTELVSAIREGMTELE
ncbi:MAG: phosphate acyltransferase PlsX, partial [Alphaproteobacteria bacterium]